MSDDRPYWLAWSRINGVGPRLVQQLVVEFGTLREAWWATSTALRTVPGIGPKLLEVITEARSHLDPDQLLEDCDRTGIQFWTAADPDYPWLLLEIPSPPAVLYYRGVVDEAENRGEKAAIAMVGTRNITDYGRRWTNQLSTHLSQHQFTIVSGMAAGVDTVAHEACLKAGGRTLAVLGTGVDVIYPKSNRRLYEQIQTQGLILSDYPPGTPPEARNFPPRNRIIAGLSRAVLVMEAAQRSGALITARYGAEFNRDVYSLPGSLDQPQSLGCLELLNSGAQLILGVKPLLEALGEIPHLDLPGGQLSLELLNPSAAIAPPLIPTAVTPPPDLDPLLKQVWEATPTEPTPLDLIMATTGLPISELSPALSQLELLDLVIQLPGMQYRRS